MAFRSKISHKLQGNSNFTLDTQGIGAIVSDATGAFIDTDASIRVEMPELLNLGIRHDINGIWSVMAEMDFTRWSRLDALDIQFSNPNQNKSVTNLEWSDTWFGSLGVEYRPSDRWQIRGGVAYEEGATSSNFRTPRVPDDDRVWLSIGGTYSYDNNIQLHAAFTHIIVKDPELDLEAAFPLITSDENDFRGNLSGEFDLDVNILSFGVTIEL
jgi:long-chain fatty acid transport protein